jgi:small-conductance mechanosensitive channel
MTDSFTNDQGNTSTSQTTTQLTPDVGNNLQQQIEVMQKRMGDKDSHIHNIEAENQQLREKMADVEARLQALGSIEDVLTKKSNQSTTSTIDEDQIVNKVLQRQRAETQKEIEQRNFNEVSATLTKLYGKEQVDTIVKKVAEEASLSFDDMISMAQKSPKALYKMLGINGSATPIVHTQSSTIGSNDDKNREQKLADFARMRREDPKLFYSSEIQKQFRDACLKK